MRRLIEKESNVMCYTFTLAYVNVYVRRTYTHTCVYARMHASVHMCMWMWQYALCNSRWLHTATKVKRDCQSALNLKPAANSMCRATMILRSWFAQMQSFMPATSWSEFAPTRNERSGSAGTRVAVLEQGEFRLSILAALVNKRVSGLASRAAAV